MLYITVSKNERLNITAYQHSAIKNNECEKV